MLQRMNRITYISGYKYVLAETASVETTIIPPKDINTTFIHLDLQGKLTVLQDYAWDGATGVPDGGDILRGSLFHDALYQLMRQGLLDHMWRDSADRLLRTLCIEDGMSPVFANFVYQG